MPVTVLTDSRLQSPVWLKLQVSLCVTLVQLHSGSLIQVLISGLVEEISQTSCLQGILGVVIAPNIDCFIKGLIFHVYTKALFLCLHLIIFIPRKMALMTARSLPSVINKFGSRYRSWFPCSHPLLINDGLDCSQSCKGIYSISERNTVEWEGK